LNVAHALVRAVSRLVSTLGLRYRAADLESARAIIIDDRSGKDRGRHECELTFRESPLSAAVRGQLFEAFLSICNWVHVYYLWRPNLRDEGDNHIVELAVAGGEAAIVTNNVGDFRSADLRFSGIRVLAPRDALRELT
jgi:hypothetical protein